MKHFFVLLIADIDLDLHTLQISINLAYFTRCCEDVSTKDWFSKLKFNALIYAILTWNIAPTNVEKKETVNIQYVTHHGKPFDFAKDSSACNGGSSPVMKKNYSFIAVVIRLKMVPTHQRKCPLFCSHSNVMHLFFLIYNRPSRQHSSWN